MGTSKYQQFLHSTWCTHMDGVSSPPNSHRPRSVLNSSNWTSEYHHPTPNFNTSKQTNKHQLISASPNIPSQSMDHHDHSHHMHSMEGHEGHGGHGGGGMDDMCSMSMLFTWDTTNLCIVFRQWHIRSNTSLVLSLIAVVFIGIGYEALRSLSRRYEASLAARLETVPNSTAHGYRDNDDDDDDENVTETPAFNRSGQNRETVSKRGHVIKATLYAIQNFYAFMLMLVFMTYNGWVMVAVSLGAFFGYLLFGHTAPATKDNACH